jgi:60 kDa SS-A/Ro ribonucleoprotein
LSCANEKPLVSRAAAELARYRKAVNREVKAFIIDIAPYRNAMAPPQDPNTYYIYGWSDSILQYIANTTQGYVGMIDTINAAKLQ